VDKAVFKKLKNLAQTERDINRVVEYKALFVYKDGIPYLAQPPARTTPQTPQERLLHFLEQCLDLPYDGNDPSLRGMTQGEAMIINWTRQASEGDESSREAIVDRLLGRPKQSVSSVQLTGSLDSFLDQVAKDMQFHTIDIPPEPKPNPNTNAEDL